MTRLAPIGFVTQSTTTPEIGVEITLVGAQAAANHGFIATANQALPRLRPFGFSTQASDYTGKGLGDNVEVTLVGAEARALATGLLGADTDIVPDGAGVEAGAGLTQFVFDYGVLITNPNASDGVTNYQVDQRTGFKELPSWHPNSEIVEDGYGKHVRKKSADPRHPQDFVRSGRNAPQSGPQNPETSDSFISDSVGPEDL